jgi:hypothetical protein
MPLRRGEPLPWMLSGCVAYYQPVAAPGNDICRFNQANGGTNVYCAADGVAPTWSPGAGWTFDGATQYLNTGCTPVSVGSWFVRFVGKATINRMPMGSGTALGTDVIGCIPNWSGAPPNDIVFYNGPYVVAGLAITSGGHVLSASGRQGYRDGLAEGGAIEAWVGPGYACAIGGVSTSGVIAAWWDSSVQAVAIYSRSLSPAEVWRVTQQMKYCDINPDWSAWGRRREWYFMGAAAVSGGRVGIYGHRGSPRIRGY